MLNSVNSLVLPTPASPPSSSTDGCPDRARSSAPVSTASCSARPTSGASDPNRATGSIVARATDSFGAISRPAESAGLGVRRRRRLQLLDLGEVRGGDRRHRGLVPGLLDRRLPP